MKVEEILHRAAIFSCKIQLKEIRLFEERRKIVEVYETDESIENIDDHLTPIQKKRLKGIRGEQDDLDWELKKYLGRITANPEIQSLLKVWDLDVTGGAVCFDPLTVEEGVSLDLVETILDKQESNSIEGKTEHYGYRDREEVRAFLSKYDFETHSSGGGVGGWDLGYSDTTDGADVFCELMYKEYKTEIETGLIVVTRRASEFPELPNYSGGWDAAERFAKEHNITID